MSILSEQFLINAIDAEKLGNPFSIDFDDVWMEYGYNQYSDTKRYLLNRSGLKAFKDKVYSQLPVTYLKKSIDKIYLSYESFKFSLARANTLAGEECLIQLIEIEKDYRKRLELTFQSSLAPVVDNSEVIAKLQYEVANLKQELEQQKKRNADIERKMQYFQAKAMGADMLERLQKSPKNFTEDGELVWLISGIASQYYFNTRCEEDLEFGVDYVKVGKKLKLTPFAALTMLLNFRSVKGVSRKYLPEKAEVDIQKLTKGTGVASKMNRRRSQPK